MSKELESNMRFKDQIPLKRLTSKKRDSLSAKPSLTAILLILIALLQIPISLKASLSIVCLLSKASNPNTTASFCLD